MLYEFVRETTPRVFFVLAAIYGVLSWAFPGLSRLLRRKTRKQLDRMIKTERMRKIGNMALMLTACALLGVFIFNEWQHFKNQLEAQNEKGLPKLVGAIDQVCIGYVKNACVNPVNGLTNSGVVAVMQMSIRNLGYIPSIAENFHLYCFEGTNIVAIGRVFSVPGTYRMNLPEANLVYEIAATDRIDEKTAKPISPGSNIRGWMMFVIPGDDFRDAHSNLTWRVSFEDVNSKPLMTIARPAREHEVSGFVPLPGSDFPVVKPYKP